MTNRNSRRPGRPPGYPKTGGRKAGTRNKVTLEARAAAAEIVDDATYRRKLIARARNGELPSGTENMFWYYAKGRPTEDAVPMPQVMAFVRYVTSLFLEVVPDVHLRRQFALGLKRRLPGGTDIQMEFESPATRALPVAESEPEEFQL
jgi:hypothetical protein